MPQNDFTFKDESFEKAAAKQTLSPKADPVMEEVKESDRQSFKAESDDKMSPRQERSYT